MPSDVLIVGAGITGLATALACVDDGLRTKIWSSRPTHTTTSAVPAAIWYPYRSAPADKVREWSVTTYEWLTTHALPEADKSGVRAVTFSEYLRRNADTTAEPDWAEYLAWADALWARIDKISGVPSVTLTDCLAPYEHGYRRTTLVMDTTRFLPWMVGRLRDRGVETAIRTVSSSWPGVDVARCVANCTGLGAAALCPDDKTAVYPIEGAVLRVRKRASQPCIIAIGNGDPIYVVPREDDVIVGGTDRHPESGPAAADPDVLRGRAAQFGPEFAFGGDDTLGDPLVAERPCRDEVRVELEGRVLHNYGHGGSGFTIFQGCANEAASALRRYLEIEDKARSSAL